MKVTKLKNGKYRVRPRVKGGDKMNIGERIKNYREANNMYQQDFANKIGVSRQAVSAWEQNRAIPRLGVIEKMAVVFNCSKIDIIGEDYLESITAQNDSEIFLMQSFRSADQKTQDMIMRLLAYSKEIKEEKKTLD